MLRRFVFSTMAVAVLASGALANTNSMANVTSDVTMPSIGERSVASDITTALKKYDFIDIVVDGKTVHMLATINTSPSSYFADPDGTKSYKKDLYLIRIDSSGKVLEHKVNTLNPQNGTLIKSGDTIKIFVNHKVQDGTYAMNGSLFKVASDTQDDMVNHPDITTVFTNANMGWFPKLNTSNDDVEHFSFAGYYRYVNTTNKGSVAGSVMADEYNAYQKAHSGGIMPESNKDTLISKVAAMYPSTTATPPPPPSNCATETVSRIVGTGWNILGATTTGCTISGLKAQGASVVYPFNAASGAYSSADSIDLGQGFWIKK